MTKELASDGGPILESCRGAAIVLPYCSKIDGIVVKAKGWPVFETWIAFLADGVGQQHLVAHFQGLVLVILPNGPDNASSFVTKDDWVLRNRQQAGLDDNVLESCCQRLWKTLLAIVCVRAAFPGPPPQHPGKTWGNHVHPSPHRPSSYRPLLAATFASSPPRAVGQTYGMTYARVLHLNENLISANLIQNDRA